MLLIPGVGVLSGILNGPCRKEWMLVRCVHQE